MGGRLPRLIAARKRYAYGKQKDCFDSPECIGWTRGGEKTKSEGAGLAVLLNASWSYQTKKMFVGNQRKGEKWTDLLDWSWGEVVIDEFGEGLFKVGPRSIGVWVKKGAKGREKIDRLSMESFPVEKGS